MEKITEAVEAIKNVENTEYYQDNRLGTLLIESSFIILLAAVGVGMVICGVVCGCLILGAYTINKCCLQPNDNPSDPNTPYKDVPVELKEITVEFETPGKQLETTDEVEIVGKTLEGEINL